MLLKLPTEFETIIDTLKHQDWLISYFPASKDEHYNPAQYLFNHEYFGIKYKIVLDRNIFRFIISSSNISKPTIRNRAAISLVCFCQASKILFEPNLAVYERLLPFKQNTTIAIKELDTFYKIDNADPQSLIDFALSKSSKIKLSTLPHKDLDLTQKKLTQHDWLKDWKSLYVILLKTIIIDCSTLSPIEKIDQLSRWILEKFRLSLPCLVFAVFLYSSKRLRKMNKMKSTSCNNDKIRQAYNMTWDLFFINEYLQSLLIEEKEYEILVATDDKITKQILRAILHIQSNESFDSLNNFLPEKDHCLVKTVTENIKKIKERVYDTSLWTLEYRDFLISTMETELLNLLTYNV